MTLAYIVIAALLVSNLTTLVVLYKLVTQLSSKVMARDLNEYKVAETPVAPTPTPGGRGLKAINNQAIDTVDPNEIMRTLAVQAGRLEEFEEL